MFRRFRSAEAGYVTFPEAGASPVQTANSYPALYIPYAGANVANWAGPGGPNPQNLPEQGPSGNTTERQSTDAKTAPLNSGLAPGELSGALIIAAIFFLGFYLTRKGT